MYADYIEITLPVHKEWSHNHIIINSCSVGTVIWVTSPPLLLTESSTCFRTKTFFHTTGMRVTCWFISDFLYRHIRSWSHDSSAVWDGLEHTLFRSTWVGSSFRRSTCLRSHHSRLPPKHCRCCEMLWQTCIFFTPLFSWNVNKHAISWLKLNRLWVAVVPLLLPFSVLALHSTVPISMPQPYRKSSLS